MKKDFMNEIGKKVSDTLAQGSKKVSDFTQEKLDLMDLKKKIADEKKALDETYKNLGKKFYESTKEPSDAYSLSFYEIQTRLERLAKFEEELKGKE